MKKALLLCLLSLAAYQCLQAQCGVGKTRCSLNWDYLAFFPSAGISPYTTLAHSQTQNFAFGTQKVTVTHNFTGTGARGVDASHTAETGAFGTGADILFVNDGTITYTFQTGVDSIRLTVNDLDYMQRLTVSSPTAVVALGTFSGTILTLTGNGTPSAQAKATNSNLNGSSQAGSVNVLITALTPITTFTLTITESTTGSSSTNGTWISDVSACSGGLFTNNYFQVSKPFTNQPGYIVASRNDSFYFVNPADGAAKFMFRDPNGKFANSVAYDPVRHEVYYAFSLTNADTSINPNNKTLRRYNYDQDTFGVVIPDVTIFAPIFEQGIESGAAAFYDGSLYLGLEANASGSNQSIVWKIDFNASGNPITSSQVYSIAGTGHDWGDIAVVNGTLVDFDSRPATPNYYHQDLYTKNVTIYTPAAVDLPRQTSVDWNNVIYNIGGSANSYTSGGVAIATGTIATYNGNGTINVSSIDTIKYNGVAQMGSWGDAGEAFKPRVDYGDAPATFDPITADPAVHETSANLYLGSNKNDEWASRGQTLFANSDNFDDGMMMGSLVNPSSGSFVAHVRYLNNTGATATICAWVDFNNNGMFDVGEGKSVTNLPSSASPQAVWLNWSGITTTLIDGSYTYLRIRITSTANGMTTSNATGYFNNGEVEDYRLIVTKNPLTTQLVNFSAARQNNGEVAVDWQLANEEAGTAYTVQRSADGIAWTDLKTVTATYNRSTATYSFTDAAQLRKIAYYRLRLAQNGSEGYSVIRKIESMAVKGLRLAPNPASDAVSVVLEAERAGTVQISVVDAIGQFVLARTVAVTAGANNLPLDVSALQPGVYWVRTAAEGEQHNQRLLIRK